jgi:hypothetical protein
VKLSAFCTTSMFDTELGPVNCMVKRFPGETMGALLGGSLKSVMTNRAVSPARAVN